MKMSEPIEDDYTHICMKGWCDKVATKEVQLKSGIWIPFCDEHIPERACYIRKIQVREDEK